MVVRFVNAAPTVNAVTNFIVDNSAHTLVITDTAGANSLTLTGKTVGDTVDWINSLTTSGIQRYAVLVLDAVRSDSATDLFVAGTVTTTTSVDGVACWDIKQDTSASKSLTVRLRAGSYVPGAQPRDWKKPHRVRVNQVAYYATLGAAARGGFKIIEVDGNMVETTVLSKLSVSATETTLYLNNLQSYIDSRYGSDIVIRLVDGTSLADAAANHLTVNFRQE